MDDDLLTDAEQAMREAMRKDEPDYRITVWCDDHLGVKMLLAHSWASVEYGQKSANLNHLLQWFCPRPECFRCYEPTMFGYHENGGVGTRREMNPLNQPRGKHPSGPFMYIGQVGQGRQFLCPLYKCDERGPKVADNVEDELVQFPANPLNDLRAVDRKRAVEMSVFRSFALSSGLEIDEGSAESREPDYPDVECMISDQKYFFELGRMISEEVAEKLNPNRRKPEGGFAYDQEKPLADVVSRKSAKRYTTDGAPVDLVLHFDLQLGTAATVAEKSNAPRFALHHRPLQAGLGLRRAHQASNLEI
jgi:hypothetical protein